MIPQAPQQFDTATVKAETIRKVYAKAKKEFDALWPTYKEWARLRDATEQAKEDARCEAEMTAWRQRREKAEEERQKLDSEYKRELFAWEGKCSWFRGPRPERRFIWLTSPSFDLGPIRSFSCVGYHEKIHAEDLRREIDAMSTLVDSGATEYHLSQAQLGRLAAWEDGRTIAAIKQRMAE
jgi:hypothetical protein